MKSHWKLTAPLSSTETAKVPGHAWVTVKNLDPIRSGNHTFSFGDTCSIDLGGLVEKVTDDTAAGTVLVKYRAPEKAYGAECPTGTLFEISGQQFATMTAQAEAAVKATQNERSRIARLLGQLR